jgi:uncharacterized OB-fold protein
MAEEPFTESSFREYLSQHKLMGSRCLDCDALFVPPRPMCPKCHSERMAWSATSGQGKLAAFTSVYIGPTAMVEAGYDRTKPYATAVVELEEGPMISAQLLGVEADHPEEITIGTPLTVTYIERGVGEEKRTFLAFQV